MPRPRSVPGYRKKGKYAVVTLPCRLTGRRRQLRLGVHGTPKSKADYARIIAEWQENEERHFEPVADLTIVELVADFLRHAREHYRQPDGSPTGEARHFEDATKPLNELYGETDVAEFGPLKFATVRRAMIALGWKRKTINHQINRIRHIFKWGASKEMFDAAIYERLRTLAALGRGRTEAAESEDIKPVPLAHYEAALPYLPAPVRGLIQFLRHTGCRPGEAAGLTLSELDMTPAVWIYAPRRHKNAWRGKVRSIRVGPHAQAAIKPFLKTDPDAAFFSPADAKREQWAEANRKRKTKRYPCEAKGKDPEAFLAKLRKFYETTRIDKALYRACDKAGVPRFSANQLRHLVGTEIRRTYGIEAAGAILGHSRLETTQVYAERDSELATRVAAEVG